MYMYIYMYVHVYALYVHVYVERITWFVEHVCSSDESFFLLPRWTKKELKEVIAMLQNPEFDSKDIDPDLYKRMDKAVLDGRIKCFNTSTWGRATLMGTRIWTYGFVGNQNFKF